MLSNVQRPHYYRGAVMNATRIDSGKARAGVAPRWLGVSPPPALPAPPFSAVQAVNIMAKKSRAAPPAADSWWEYQLKHAGELRVPRAPWDEDADTAAAFKRTLDSEEKRRLEDEQERRHAEKVGRNWIAHSTSGDESVRNKRIATEFLKRQKANPEYSRLQYFRDVRGTYGIGKSAFLHALKSVLGPANK